MSVLSYGAVTMQIVRTNRCDRVEIPTDDGADHKWTEWTIDVDCWYNPAAMSYGGDVTGTFALAGRLPPQTDAAILEYLMQPRRPIIYADELGNSTLVCPEPGFITDVNNGPFVKRCTVNQIHGDKTWSVNIVLTACVRRCAVTFNGHNIKNPLIANRWTQYEDYDEDYFSTITTEGVAVFDGAELIRLGVYPDQYRRDLFFPIPINYKREPFQITALPDGNSVAYRIVDRQKPLNINSNLHAMGITRIEAYHTVGWDRHSAYAFIGNVVQTGGQAGINASPAGPQASAIWGTANGLGAAARMLPQYHSGIVVNIWGNRDSTRRDLTAVGIRIAQARVGANTLRRSVGFNVTHDVTGKFVRIEINYNWGIDQIVQDVAASVPNLSSDFATLLGGAFTWLLGNPATIGPAAVAADLGPAAAFINAQFPGPWDNTLNILGSGDPSHKETINGEPNQPSPDSDPALAVIHPPPPRSNMTRGTSLVNVVAQLLTGPCEIPDQPFLVRAGDLRVYD